MKVDRSVYRSSNGKTHLSELSFTISTVSTQDAALCRPKGLFLKSKMTLNFKESMKLFLYAFLFLIIYTFKKSPVLCLLPIADVYFGLTLQLHFTLIFFTLTL